MNAVASSASRVMAQGLRLAAPNSSVQSVRQRGKRPVRDAVASRDSPDTYTCVFASCRSLHTSSAFFFIIARHPKAFAKHAMEFWLGPGGEHARAFELAETHLFGL